MLITETISSLFLSSELAVQSVLYKCSSEASSKVLISVLTFCLTVKFFPFSQFICFPVIQSVLNINLLNHSKTLRFKSRLLEKHLIRSYSPTQILSTKGFRGQCHDRPCPVLIMIFGRALRLFLHDPKSQAYLLT